MQMTGEQTKRDVLTVPAPYDQLSRAERYIHQTRDAALLRMLAAHNISLRDQRILELGCGSGSFLQSLLAYGADRARLAAIDRDFRRVRRARNAAGVAPAVADGALVPYRDNAFDLVFIFTALSSMIDIEVRRHAAHETMRVLRPGGMAVIYDFSVNPFNTRVVPISANELRHIFEPHKVDLERVTLAPPIVRLTGGQATLCRVLEHAPFLRTHMLAAVVKEASGA
jgi:ubiquinone/menaquinone biosynthesis C-methylase UbiE